MENPIKIKLIELAESILAESNSMDLIEIRTKAQELYEKATIACYLQESKEEIITSERENIPEKEVETPQKEEIKISEPEEEINPNPTKEYLEDLLSDVSAEVIFEDKRNVNQKKSLNDNFSRTIKIGLNDRIAFIKHLFNSDDVDFLNTVKRIDEASCEEEVLDFIQNDIKPKYNNWEGKEIYQSRFMHWVTNRFK